MILILHLILIIAVYKWKTVYELRKLTFLTFVCTLITIILTNFLNKTGPAQEPTEINRANIGSNESQEDAESNKNIDS